MILPMIASIFLIIAIVCFLNLTPQQISQDLRSVLSKKPNLRDRAMAHRAGKNKKHTCTTDKTIVPKQNVITKTKMSF